MNRRQQAASRLAIYSVITSGLGWPPGARRELPVLQPPTLTPCLPLPLSLPSMPLSFSPSPSLPVPLSLGPHPDFATPVKTLGPLRSVARDESFGWYLPLGRQVGHCDCSPSGCSFSLSLRSQGVLFWSLLYFIVLGGVFGGGGGRKKSLFSWGLSVPSETFTKVMFSCLWWSPRLPMGTGGQAIGA